MIRYADAPYYASNLDIRIGNNPPGTDPTTSGNPICRMGVAKNGTLIPFTVTCYDGPMVGRYVTIQRAIGSSIGVLALCEVKVRKDGLNSAQNTTT